MSGLTAEQKQKLDGLILEYGRSLTRTNDDKENRKAMEELAATLLIKPSHFRKLATAIWRDKRELEETDLSDQLALFSFYSGQEPS